MTDQDNQEVADATTSGQSQDQSILAGGEPAEQGASQTTETSWKDSLPAELKSAKSLGTINTIEDLAKSYVNSQSVIGRRFEDLTPEQLDHYYKTQGRPETPDGYDLSVPEELAANIDPDLQDFYKQKAHEFGLNSEQAAGLYAQVAQFEAEKQAQAEELKQIELKEQADQLKKDFGPAFDERVELANRALNELGGEEAIAAIEELGAINNPALVKLLANAGELISEGKLSGAKTTGKFGMTSEEANQKITDLRKDPEFMKHYTNPASSRHAEAKKQFEDLYKIKVNSV